MNLFIIYVHSGRLAMVDIAEVNPNIGDKKDVDLTVKNTVDVVARFYGNRRQGIAPTGYEIPQAVIRRNSVINAA